MKQNTLEFIVFGGWIKHETNLSSLMFYFCFPFVFFYLYLKTEFNHGKPLTYSQINHAFFSEFSPHLLDWTKFLYYALHKTLYLPYAP